MGDARPLAGASCLVLGAGGFIGSHLCRALVEAGAQVHGFGRRPVFADSLPRLRFTAAEFADRAALARAVDGVDIVFHLLGGTTPEVSNRDPGADLETAALASIHLLQLCRTAVVRKVVFISSGGTVYGISGSAAISEAAPTDPISGYGISKLAIEKYVQLFAHLGGARAISLRVSNPFGPFQHPRRRQGIVPAVIDALLGERPVEVWGDGSVVRDYIFVSDVAAAMIAAAVYDGGEQVFNVGSGRGQSVLEVIEAVSRLTGRVARIDFRSGRGADVPVNVLDIGKARRVLGWSPAVEWDEGLARTIGWMERYGGSLDHS